MSTTIKVYWHDNNDRTDIREFIDNTFKDVDMTIPGKATAVESSGTHHVVLAEDGKVYAFGNNDHGQCDVSGWQL